MFAYVRNTPTSKIDPFELFEQNRTQIVTDPSPWTNDQTAIVLRDPSNASQFIVLTDIEITKSVLDIPGGGICIAGGRKLVSISRHAINRIIERGVSPQNLLQALKNPIRTIRQAGDKTLHEGKKATAVVSDDGNLVTTWSKTKK